MAPVKILGSINKFYFFMYFKNLSGWRYDAKPNKNIFTSIKKTNKDIENWSTTIIEKNYKHI